MDSLLQHSALLVVSYFVGLWCLKKYLYKGTINPQSLPLPPGPKGYPLIGNLSDLPTHKPWLAYHDMFKKHGQLTKAVLPSFHLTPDLIGDMVYLNVLGQGFLVLGSLERTNDLFERRSSNYSDRPQTAMIMDL